MAPKNSRRGISVAERSGAISMIAGSCSNLKFCNKIIIFPKHAERREAVPVAAGAGFEMWAFLHYADTMRFD
jgi:hypothetical protein